MNKNALYILILGSLLSLTGITAQADEPGAENIYKNLKDEVIVQFNSGNGPLIGSSVSQKNNLAGRPSFCRQTHPVVPNPTYSYECFYRTLTGMDAETLYSATDTLALAAIFRSVTSGEILVGRSWNEKYIGSPEATICVRTAAVALHPIATYTCYSNRGGIGGAVSGGN